MGTINIEAVPAVELHVNGSSFLADQDTALNLAHDIIDSLGIDILATSFDLQDAVEELGR